MGIAYRFPFVPLHDRELALIKHTLHHKPRQGLFVLRVDAGSFDELAFQFFDAIRVRLRGQVDRDCVDHLEGGKRMRGELEGGDTRLRRRSETIGNGDDTGDKVGRMRRSWTIRASCQEGVKDWGGNEA